MKLSAIALALSTCLAGSATTLKLIPIHLGNGYVIDGTIETDGTVGFLTVNNFVRWNVVVTQTTDSVFTEANTTARNISQIRSDGKKIYVPTSVDGFTDGGSLTFLSGAGVGSIPSGALVADFSGVNILGGVAGWQTPFALNYLSLNQPDNTVYTAAVSAKNNPNTFHITKVVISTAPTVMTLSGTITTDGTVGPLAPANFKSWRLVGREQDIQKYTEVNSQIINAAQVFSNNTTLDISNPGGVLQIGIPALSPRGRPIIVTIADFTDPADPNGIASYFYGFQGLVAAKQRLTKNPTYTVANVK